MFMWAFWANGIFRSFFFENINEIGFRVNGKCFKSMTDEI